MKKKWKIRVVSNSALNKHEPGSVAGYMPCPVQPWKRKSDLPHSTRFSCHRLTSQPFSSTVFSRLSRDNEHGIGIIFFLPLKLIAVRRFKVYDILS